MERAQEWVAIAGIRAAVATAVYTGYLFGQAKACDLWQSALLVPHLLVQAVLLGAARCCRSCTGAPRRH